MTNPSCWMVNPYIRPPNEIRLWNTNMIEANQAFRGIVAVDVGDGSGLKPVLF